MIIEANMFMSTEMTQKSVRNVDQIMKCLDDVITSMMYDQVYIEVNNTIYNCRDIIPDSTDGFVFGRYRIVFEQALTKDELSFIYDTDMLGFKKGALFITPDSKLYSGTDTVFEVVETNTTPDPRHILFKAISIQNDDTFGKWVYGGIVESYYDGEVYIIEGNETLTKTKVNRFSVCQSTGYYDCRDNPIYENDILEHTRETEQYTVSFDGYRYIVKDLLDNEPISNLKYFLECSEKYTVISGNIHNNKD